MQKRAFQITEKRVILKSGKRAGCVAFFQQMQRKSISLEALMRQNGATGTKGEEGGANGAGWGAPADAQPRAQAVSVCGAGRSRAFDVVYISGVYPPRAHFLNHRLSADSHCGLFPRRRAIDGDGRGVRPRQHVQGVGVLCHAAGQDILPVFQRVPSGQLVFERRHKDAVWLACGHAVWAGRQNAASPVLGRGDRDAFHAASFAAGLFRDGPFLSGVGARTA